MAVKTKGNTLIVQEDTIDPLVADELLEKLKKLKAKKATSVTIDLSMVDSISIAGVQVLLSGKTSFKKFAIGEDIKDSLVKDLSLLQIDDELGI